MVFLEQKLPELVEERLGLKPKKPDLTKWEDFEVSEKAAGLGIPTGTLRHDRQNRHNWWNTHRALLKRKSK